MIQVKVYILLNQVCIFYVLIQRKIINYQVLLKQAGLFYLYRFYFINNRNVKGSMYFIFRICFNLRRLSFVPIIKLTEN
jgi:hypothetical protein